MTFQTVCDAFLVLLGLTSPQADAIDEFGQMERNLAAAYMRGDRGFVDALLADDWTSTDYLGRVWTKSNVLALFGPGGPTFTKAEIDVDRVRVLGEVAVVTGRSVSAGRFEGRDINVTQRYTDIYVRRDGRWRVVASHGTEIR